jgi:SAM-dependent methyltransferase
MDRWKYFAILHRHQRILNPLSLAKLDELIELIRLSPGSRVLDMACGKAEFLCRIVPRWQASGVGVDLSPYFVEDARARVADRGQRERIEIREQDGAHFEAPPGSFDAALCLGASWIFKGHAGTLRALAGWTRPGGYVVVGEPFWKREPSPEYLKAAELRRDSFGTHLGNVETGGREGLLFLHTIVSSEDDWDRYEGYHRYATEMYAAEHPEDAEVPELLRSVRAYGDDAYLRWGRDTLGWAVYLFRKPR